MDNKHYDFSGWATKANIVCSDGRTIMKHAFKDDDGKTVPLVWSHNHSSPDCVLGHAVLKDVDGDVYAYCFFNDSDQARQSKLLVEHGDIKALSIYANKLKQEKQYVLHGVIREVSLVLAGANPGAFIDNVMSHGEEMEDSAIIYSGEDIELYHSDDNDSKEKNDPKEDNKMKKEEKKDDKTVQEVFDSLTEEQKTVVYALVGAALEEKENKSNDEKKEGEKNDMKHNVFSEDENGKTKETTLSHSDELEIIADAKRNGSLKDAVLEHGITNIDYLFPDAQNVTRTPGFIDRDQTWVDRVMKGVHHTPFSRVKSTFANITADEARAKGYVKGNQKTDEVFTLLKRTTDPTTVYKKQSLDRDDIIDITDFDAVAWVKFEMRGKLDEELARAYLIGDGRLGSSPDKIDENKIRPIWTDADLYSVKASFTVTGNTTDAEKAKAFIRASIKARKNYKGSGNPTMYMTEDLLTECLLLEDNTGRTLYEDETKLAKKLRVKEIITVPVMENQSRVVGANTNTLCGIIVNLIDYNVGADKGGAVNMFEDFDINYNKEKFLIETRCSGALVVPYSAIVIESSITTPVSNNSNPE